MLNVFQSLRCCVLVLLCLNLTACAGFRAGVESIAYIGSADQLPPKPGPSFQSRHNLDWNDVQLSVELNNKLQTRDHTVMLFVVPTTIDPFDKFIGAKDTNKLVAYVEMKSMNSKLLFDPAQARFLINGQPHAPVKASEYARWTDDGQVNNVTGKWGYRDVPAARVLQDPLHNYSFRIEFDLERPSPREENFQLDLSKALQSPNGEPGPVVKFKAVPWKQGYT